MKNIKKILLILLMLNLIFIGINTEKSYAIEDKTYRALLIGNSQYPIGGKLKGPAYDLPRVENVLRNSKFKDTKNPMQIRLVHDARKQDILQKIESTFRDAKEGDVSYFYFGGHGIAENGISYIIGVDRNPQQALLSSEELKQALDRVKGTKVILLDSCFSGGFIARSSNTLNTLETEKIKEEYKDFNTNFINTFKGKDAEVKTRSLGGEDYKILTAASKDEYSFELIGDPEFDYGGEFTTSFIRGTGYNGKYLADKNKDGTVTLTEIYLYTLLNVKNSLVQFYPNNSEFPIVQYGQESEPTDPEGELIKANLEVNNNVIFNINFSGIGNYNINIINDKRQIIYTETDLIGKPGENQIIWNGKDKQGLAVEDGIYTLEIEINRNDRLEFDFDKTSKLKDINIEAMETENKLEQIKIPVILKEDGKISIDLYHKSELIGTVVEDDLLYKETLKEYIIDKEDYNLDDYNIRDINIKIDIN